MNAIPLINVAPPKRDNEKQLRQEVNTSLVALKREAFNLETLIAQAAQTLVEVNERITDLENVQGDYVKKTDVTDTIVSGNMNPVTSNAVATSNAMPVDTVTNGNMHSVTSNAVAVAMKYNLEIEESSGIATYGRHYELTIDISQKVSQGYRLASWLAYTGLQDYSGIDLYYLNYSTVSPNPRLILQIRGVSQSSSPLRIHYVLIWYKPI